ncbi:MAG: L-lactate permease [Oscillospiraceae bacterium]|nr:L-lactate permease [Oscillospiraceae bacterium]
MLTILTLIPIAAILLCLIVFKLSVAKSGAISLALALILAVAFFGITHYGIMVASGKALWLALFVSLIVWNALFLYHLVSDFGAIEVINDGLMAVLKDKFVAFVLLSWLFTGLLQGIAGFGIPSVIVAPILIALGFESVKSVSASLLGHSWAVTFGSMGAAFFVMQGITGIPEAELGFPMWVFNVVTRLLTGIGVCWIYNGAKGIKKGLSYVVPTSVVTAAVQYFLIRFGMYSVTTILTALSGIVFMFLLYKFRERFKNTAVPPEHGNTVVNGRKRLSLPQSVLPYVLILILLLSFQFIPLSIRQKVSIAPNFPATATTLEAAHEVPAALGYNPIRLFAHPAMVLIIAAVVACIIYKKTGIWDSKTYSGKVKGAAVKTVKKGIPATLALLAFGHTSLIMMDSGMMLILAKSIARLTGNFYPFAAPFIGTLATFLTGNNTNSNVMFGEFQYSVAQELGLSGAVMSGAQSIAGGLGCAIASTLVLMAALATKQTDKVSVILKKLIPLVMIIVAVMGIVNYILIHNY